MIPAIHQIQRLFLLDTVTAVQVDGRWDRYRVVAAGGPLGTE